MSDITIFQDSSGALAIPDYLQGAALNVSEGLLAVAGQGGNRIGLKGSRFRIIVGGKEEAVLETTYMDVHVLGVVPYYSLVYYEGTYQAGENQAPTCYSENGVVPNDDVKAKQNAKCDTCPMNMKGSKIVDGGVKVKACGYFQRLIIAVVDDPEFRIFKLDVKSQGLFGDSKPTANKYNLRDYAKFISNRGVDVAKLITRISFDTDSSVPKLLFAPAAFPNAAQFERIKQAVASEEVKHLLQISMATMDLSQETKEDETGVAAAAEQVTPAAKAQTTPAPTPKPKQEVAPPAAPEPAKKQYVGVPEKLGAFSIQDMLNEGWTKEALLEHGYIKEFVPEPPAPPKPPAAPAAPPAPPKPPAPPAAKLAAAQIESVPMPGQVAAKPAAVTETASDAELDDILNSLQ